MITFEARGDFKRTEKFLQKMGRKDIFKSLENYGREGVNALASATPSESGQTAASWGYEVHSDGKSYSISWTNHNVNGGIPIVILLQYGHGTGTGGYVSGRDFINPAVKPIFDKIAENVWKEVTSA